MDNYSLSDIIAVAVIYNLKIEESVTLKSLNLSSRAFSTKLDILIYDNSPALQDAFTADVYTSLNCTYFHDPANPGVSRAYNYAAEQAVSMKKKFILLLDQDTLFPEDSLPKYIRGINTYPDHQMYCPILQTSRGVFSPLKYYFRRGIMWNDVKPGVYSLENKSALNSGLLVNLAAYRAAGGYNEKIELYFSDFDFVNRFKRKFNQFVVLDIQCRHSLSDIDTTDLLSAIRRFKFYVNGSYTSILTFTDYTYLFATILLRSIKLSWQYKNHRFVSIFLKKYLIDKIL